MIPSAPSPRLHGHDAPLVGNEPMVEQFRTPRGRTASLAVRPGTSDHNTLYSCLDGDEYGLRDVELGEGTALDIGAHIGGVTVALALDNKAAHIIAVEALGANVALLRHNCEINGIAERVTVIHGAATDRHTPRTVRWNFDAGEVGQHHRFIANAQLAGPHDGEAETVAPWTLADLPGEIVFAKVDCELCEYDVLRSPWVKRIAEMRGEFHAGYQRIVALLGATHVVTQTGGSEAFGAFRAVRR